MSHKHVAGKQRYTAAQDVRIEQRDTCFQGFYRLDRLRLQHRLFAGAMGPSITRELFVRPDAVCVLPYDPHTETVVLLEQFRVGALDKRANPWLLEIVAGLIDPGEQPEETAQREAIEEAGLEFSQLIPVSQYYPSPGGSDERVYLYIGLCSTAGVDGRVCGVVAEGEDIRAHVLSVETALRYVAEGQVDNAAGIIALQWLALNKGALASAID